MINEMNLTKTEISHLVAVANELAEEDGGFGIRGDIWCRYQLPSGLNVDLCIGLCDDKGEAEAYAYPVIKVDGQGYHTDCTVVSKII